jgi:hypothetical protein
LRGLFRDKSIETCSSSTTHGLPKIYRTKYKAIKFMWAILIFFSVGFCSYFTIRGIIEYFQFDTRTSIKTKAEAYIEFRALNFWLTYFFSNPEASQKIIYDFVERKTGVKMANLTDYKNFSLSSDHMDLVFLAFELQQNLNLPAYNDSERRSIGFNKSEFVLECKFNQIECNMSYIIWKFDTIFVCLYKFYKMFLPRFYNFKK